MPTPAQSAFADGFADLAEVHGNTWTFGRSRFAGVASALEPTDPRLSGSSDRRFKLTVRTSLLPSVRPARGDEVARAGVFYRIEDKPDHEDTGNTVFILVPA